MEWVIRRTSLVWRRKSMFWILTVLFVKAAAETSHPHSSPGISAPHLYYTCPEGVDVKMECVKDESVHSLDDMKRNWLFTPFSDQECKAGMGPRHISYSHPHVNSTTNAGLHFGHTKKIMWVILQNVTRSDQGRYCCAVRDPKVHSSQVPLRYHSHIVLHITPGRKGNQNCSLWAPTAPGGTVPVALALAACILALLSLPLILVLVYKQRQSAQSNRRAQELVRMDSEAQGHENPVFLGGSPQPTTRTVSQNMTRQSSETGRRLLAEPGTPLSPPTRGDVFFPSEEPIVESPALLHN
uniref:Chromosome 10 open reading frame 54 n=1 Tax=Nothobranchius kadleci TaxID=1051664 RepID=A0A1A8E895_NOTKA